MQVHRAHDRITAAGARAVAIGTGAPYQAKALMDDGLAFPCLIDAEARAYRRLGIGRLSLLGMLAPAGARRYFAAMRRGARQGRFTGDIRQLPGLAILAPDATVRWVHRGAVLGDYPPLGEVLDRLEAEGRR